MSGIEIGGMSPLIQVFDMPTSIRFYTEVLGFEVIETSEPGEHFDWAWLRRDGAELMLNTQYETADRPADRDPTRTSAHRDTAFFFSCSDVDVAYRHLQAHGLAVEPPVTRDYGMRQVSVSDPDGYEICFQCPV